MYLKITTHHKMTFIYGVKHMTLILNKLVKNKVPVDVPKMKK